MKATRKPSARRRPRRVLRPAATKAVINTMAQDRGGPWVEQSVPRKWRRNYRRLLRLREELLATRGELMRKAAEPISSSGQHMADAASDDFEHDLALGELSLEQNALYEVEEALRRIECGTYGVCEVTGRSIPAARLAVVPWTRFTAEAGARLERGGAVGRAKLGALRSVRDKENATGLAEAPEQQAEEDAPDGVAPEDQLWTIRTPVVATPRGRACKPPARHRDRHGWHTRPWDIFSKSR